MKEKEQVGADIYVDDSPSNVERLRAKGFYAICFANSTNQKTPPPRAKSWDEVSRLIHDWALARKAPAAE
jgi:5'(3')-deoxyribonucleotidase